MKDRAIVILTAVVVVVVAGGVWLFVPTLESPERKLDERVGASAERARRTVAQFDAETDAAAALVDRAGLAADVTPEKIDEVVNANEQPAQEAVAAEQERLQALQKSAVARMRQLDAEFTELDRNAQLTPPAAPTFNQNPEAMKRDLAKGIQQREKFLAENRALVNQALTDAKAALQDQEGDASGRNSPVANQLSGMALIQEAAAAEREATLHRQEVATRLYDMREDVRSRAEAAANTGVVKASDINETIADREETLKKAQAAHAKMQEQVTDLQQRIDGLQRQIDEQDAIAADARTRMEALSDRGIDYGDPNAAADFATAYNEAAHAYRVAVRTKHTLQYGGLENARIDSSGDLLKGEFVSATPGGTVQSVEGLVDLQSDLAVAQGDLDGAATQVRIAETQLAAAKATREQLQQREDNAGTRMASLADKIAKDFTVYQQAADATQAAEDLAIRKYRDAASAFNNAQSAQAQMVQAVPADLPADAKDRSPYKYIEDDNWIGAEAKSEAADAQVAAALVCNARIKRLQHALAVLDEVNTAVPLAAYDRGAIEQQIATTRDEGIELAEKATRALESAARDLKNHWTVAASVAAANYVMSLFGRPELRNLAMQNYAEVVKGREDNPEVRPYRMRFEQLRSTAAKAEATP
ncbi:MAG TPA: hypothetical protein P5572_03490 [Phycisphaerae bacterium]|nr:hypothetical protein [Phycisphaerales bacterium]HRX84062.1 hypothetical protein [Phycisphaerae bacterium]